ncbi:tetratricopeptide repeat protein, partial [Planctomycetota bacterium]
MPSDRRLLIGICLILLFQSCDQVSQHPQVSEGRALHKAGRFEDAIPLYRQALKETSKDVLALTEWGEALAALGRDGEAAGKYRQALAIQPDFIPARESLADCLTARGRHQEALEIYTELAAEGDQRAVNGMGVAMCRLRDYDNCLIQLKKAVAVDPDSISAHVNLAIMLSYFNEDKQAIGHLTKALEIDPDSIPALCQMGSIMRSLKRKDEARDHYSRAAQLIPEDRWDWWHISNAFLALKYSLEDHRKNPLIEEHQISLLKQALSVNPHFRTLWGYLGRLFDYEDRQFSRECYKHIFDIDMQARIPVESGTVSMADFLARIRDFSNTDIVPAWRSSFDFEGRIGFPGRDFTVAEAIDMLQKASPVPVYSYLDKYRSFTHALFLGDPAFLAGLPGKTLSHEIDRVKILPPNLERKTTFDFLETPMSEVLAVLAKDAGLPFRIKAYAGSKDKDFIPIRERSATLRVANMRIASALNWICRLADCRFSFNGREIQVEHGTEDWTVKWESVERIFCRDETDPRTRALLVSNVEGGVSLLAVDGVLLADADDGEFLAVNNCLFLKQEACWQEYFTNRLLPAGLTPVFGKRLESRLVVIACREGEEQADTVQLILSRSQEETIVDLSSFLETPVSGLSQSNFAFDFARSRLFWIDVDSDDWPEKGTELPIYVLDAMAGDRKPAPEKLAFLTIKAQVKSFYVQDGCLYITDDYFDSSSLFYAPSLEFMRTRRMDCATFQLQNLSDTPFGWSMDLVVGKYALAGGNDQPSIGLAESTRQTGLRSNALGCSPNIRSISFFRTGS